ncbi:MAG: hypothetical protein PWQ10_188 [Patescibacteria group bacterium]|nr:hypothetical protein [Patescibacteria group bacterium]
MIKSFIYKILEKRHFWRYATFGEIAELYALRTIRVIAMNIVSGFTSVYLYEAGYSIMFIIFFWLCFYVVRMPLSFVSSYIVTIIGPRRGILISNLLYVPSMISLGLLPIIGTWSILLWGFFMSISASIYQICYMVDFSRVKNVKNAGKELAFINIIEKVAIGISPIIGGVIALWFGLPVVIWITAGLFILSSLPIFWLIEPMPTRQKISFRGFPWKTNVCNIIAQLGVGFDVVTTGVIWSLFIVIAVFPGHGWDIYVKLGILSSVTILTAIIVSYAYGKLIDNSKGKQLLITSVLANSLVHLSRPFASTASFIVGVNITNEISTTGYDMACLRGVFDAADTSGHRVAYLCFIDIMSNLGAAIACAILLLCIFVLDDINGFKLFFIMASIFVLIIGVARFNIYHE